MRSYLADSKVTDTVKGVTDDASSLPSGHGEVDGRIQRAELQASTFSLGCLGSSDT